MPTHKIPIKYRLSLLWLFIVCGCTQSDQKVNISPITISVSTTPLSMPFYMAEHSGLFRKYCGDLQVVDVSGGKNSFQKMINGDADFATSSESVMVFQSFQRADFVNLATFVQSVNDIKLVAHKASALTDVVALRGKKVGYIKGTSSDYMLSILLALYDLSKEDVSFVELAADESVQALVSRRVDAVSTWEPYAYQALVTLGENAVVMDSKHLYSLTFNLVSRRKYVNEHPREVECVLKALYEAINLISLNPQEAKRVLKQRLGLGDDFIQWVWPDYLFKLSLNHSLVMSMESQKNWLINTGVFPKTPSPDPRHFIDPKPLQAVIPTAVRF